MGVPNFHKFSRRFVGAVLLSFCRDIHVDRSSPWVDIVAFGPVVIKQGLFNTYAIWLSRDFGPVESAPILNVVLNALVRLVITEMVKQSLLKILRSADVETLPFPTLVFDPEQIYPAEYRHEFPYFGLRVWRVE